MMKQLILLLACSALAGCDYSIPLTKSPELEIDSSVVGLWQRPKENGQIERLLVLPLGPKEYLVSFPAGSTNAMFARAYLCRSIGRTLIQLEWIGTARGVLPKDSRQFQFASYTVTPETVSIRLLNADLVKRDVKTAEELAKAIADNLAHPALFRDEMVFKKEK